MQRRRRARRRPAQRSSTLSLVEGGTLAQERKFLLLDANAVVSYFLPRAAPGAKAHERIQIIVDAVRKRAVLDLVLFVPNVSIPEVFGVFDKYAYGRWNQQVKKPIDGRRYKTIRDGFHRYVRHGSVFEQCEVNRYHVLATDLISPIDHRFQIRRKRRQLPMGAADNLIVAMGIALTRIHGPANFAIVTTDQRMVDGVERAKRINPNTAEAMGLPKQAEKLGYTWGPELYPPMIHLTRVTKTRLVEFFGQWPLPTRSPQGVKPWTKGIGRHT